MKYINVKVIFSLLFIQIFLTQCSSEIEFVPYAVSFNDLSEEYRENGISKIVAYYKFADIDSMTQLDSILLNDLGQVVYHYRKELNFGFNEKIYKYDSSNFLTTILYDSDHLSDSSNANNLIDHKEYVLTTNIVNFTGTIEQTYKQYYSKDFSQFHKVELLDGNKVKYQKVFSYNDNGIDKITEVHANGEESITTYTYMDDKIKKRVVKSLNGKILKEDFFDENELIEYSQNADGSKIIYKYN